MGAVCSGYRPEGFQKDGRLEPIVRNGRIVIGITADDEYEANEQDNDAAINYALKRNRNSMKENHTIKELMFSAQDLPNTIQGRPDTFAVLYVNLHSLEDHDLKEITGLTEREVRDLKEEVFSDDEIEEEKKKDAT